MEVGKSSLQCTAHARVRMKQRAIDECALQTLREYARAAHQPGGSQIQHSDLS